jgi:octaprenyl-diphosphate synthase
VVPVAASVLGMLSQVTAGQGMDLLSAKLDELRAWIGSDLLEVEARLMALLEDRTPAHGSAKHLIQLGGKRLRPLCVALAARVGGDFNEPARELAVAVELVHSATLLHDDVIDMGDRRRGAEAARVIYGNAASIYAGDLLLVDALRRIQATRIPGLLEKSLGVLNEMLEAEALQLANRGSVRSTVSDYFRVIEGKTASLFRWALFAGGRAGGVPMAGCLDLERFGNSLGLAFQIIDDVLDLTGDPTVVGKSLFADLHEGKMTYPLLLAIERDAELADQIEAACSAENGLLNDALHARIAEVLRRADIVPDCLQLATRWAGEAVQSLSRLPASRARRALEEVAHTLVRRAK